MIFFAGISPKKMIRVLFPYVLGFLTIIAVLFVFLDQTDRIYDRNISSSEDRYFHITENLLRISENADLSAVVFTPVYRDGIVFKQLKPDFLNCFELRECTIAQSLQEEGFGWIPFDGDTLAASAISNGIPYTRRTESEQNAGFTIFYPVQDSEYNPSLAKIVFYNSDEMELLNRCRYSFFLLAVAAVILIIIPGIILRLANLRRKIEKRGSFEGDSGNDKAKCVYSEKINLNAYPASVLEGSEPPALFKLDGLHAILHMNSAAESLIDLAMDDVMGMKFHDLPCFTAGEGNPPKYPEPGEIGEFVLNLTDSLGQLIQAMFRIESLGDSGFAISARTVSEESGSVGSDRLHLNPEEQRQTATGLPGTEIQKAIDLAEEGRKLAGNDFSRLQQFTTISDILSGIKQNIQRSGMEQTGVIEISTELKRIASALNDVLPERASIEVEVPEFLPEIECSLNDFTQIIKNLVFYSLESVTGLVRIRLGARDVPSPISDSVFSANCDRSVPRSVSVSYSDGTRIPVLLKEALLDPETDTSGIQRDFGSHVSQVAAVLARLDSHPVFTEGSLGTSLNVLFSTSENYLFDISNDESRQIDIESISIAICDTSRAVRESVSDVLVSYGMQAVPVSSLEFLEREFTEFVPDYLVLDVSVLEESPAETLSTLRQRWPDMKIVFSAGSSGRQNEILIEGTHEVKILHKPYSPDDLLDIIEFLEMSDSTKSDIQENSGRFE